MQFLALVIVGLIAAISPPDQDFLFAGSQMPGAVEHLSLVASVPHLDVHILRPALQALQAVQGQGVGVGVTDGIQIQALIGARNAHLLFGLLYQFSLPIGQQPLADSSSAPLAVSSNSRMTLAGSCGCCFAIFCARGSSGCSSAL
ncbi:hypothetical protein D3C76_1134090 [compost metagenome]